MSYDNEKRMLDLVLLPYRQRHHWTFVRDRGIWSLTRGEILEFWVMTAGADTPELCRMVAEYTHNTMDKNERVSWKLIVAHASLLYPDYQVGGE